MGMGKATTNTPQMAHIEPTTWQWWCSFLCKSPWTACVEPRNWPQYYRFPIWLSWGTNILCCWTRTLGIVGNGDEWWWWLWKRNYLSQTSDWRNVTITNLKKIVNFSCSIVGFNFWHSIERYKCSLHKLDRFGQFWRNEPAWNIIVKSINSEVWLPTYQESKKRKWTGHSHAFQN